MSEAATNTKVTFNTSVVLESSGRPHVGIYTLCPGKDSTHTVTVTVPFVFVDVQYNADPIMVQAFNMNYQLFYEDVPQAVRKTVTCFLAPKVDIGCIKFTEPQRFTGGVNNYSSYGFPVKPDLEWRLSNLERQTKDILPLLRSKL